MGLRRLSVTVLLSLVMGFVSTVQAEGEAGVLSLRGQGHFYVGLEQSEPADNGSVRVKNQMYVGYQLVAEPRHPYPLILVHGGGGQSVEWFSTPDGRDGWRDYFLAAGFDVYWVDRPGYGRSSTNKQYGELRDSADTRIIKFLARSEHWPGEPADTDPSIINFLAGSSPGPYAGDEVAAQGLAELLDRIGPAILLGYSAGATSAWWAFDARPEKVAGLIAVEPGLSNVTRRLRQGLHFAPPLPRDFEPVTDEEGCQRQAAESPSLLPSFQGKPIHLVGSEMGLIGGLACAVKAFAQAGVTVNYTYLPDLGIKGNGHFMMSETNNGEVAEIIIDLAAGIQ